MQSNQCHPNNNVTIEFSVSLCMIHFSCFFTLFSVLSYIPFSPQMRRKSGWKWMYKTGGYQADMNGQRLAVVCLQLITGWYIVIPASVWSLCAFLKNWVADPAFCKRGLHRPISILHTWFTEIQCLQCCIEALYGASVLCQAQKKKKIHTFVILGRALIYRSMYMQCFSMQSLFLSTNEDLMIIAH